MKIRFIAVFIVLIVIVILQLPHSFALDRSSTEAGSSGGFAKLKSIHFPAMNSFSCVRQAESQNKRDQDKIEVAYYISTNQEPDYVMVAKGHERILYSRSVENRPVHDDSFDIPKICLEKIGSIALSSAANYGASKILRQLLPGGILLTLVSRGVGEIIHMTLTEPVKKYFGDLVMNDRGEFLDATSNEILYGSRLFSRRFGLKNSDQVSLQLCQLDHPEVAKSIGLLRIN